ncbi:PREDICTED: transmembrane protein 201-like [Priapulus caudatus]|uniref:Transmembrane protein 201-like n=1 Tax=Priapulus caudatus TaxID=37621 RepID=A0ABM1ELT8_PRICU|nr:PREDICTED: transmembrane protein 201-like [Priapulus caudatus]
MLSLMLSNLSHWARLSVKVNCWFCNHDSFVPYSNRNCFTCSICEQYNGFTQEGDYNRLIPEQHCEELNKRAAASQHALDDSSGRWDPLTKKKLGLCATCSQNQLLKVKQLSAFVPFNEHTYDAEIEQYERNLEKAYALCATCDAIIRQELRWQTRALNAQLTVSKQASEFVRPKQRQSHMTALNARSNIATIQSRCWEVLLSWRPLIMLLRLITLACSCYLVRFNCQSEPWYKSLLSAVCHRVGTVSPESVLVSWWQNLNPVEDFFGPTVGPEKVAVLVGLYASVLAIVISGSKRLQQIDGATCITWLLLMVQHFESFFTIFGILRSSINNLKCISSMVVMVISLCSFVCSREHAYNRGKRKHPRIRRSSLGDGLSSNESVNTSADLEPAESVNQAPQSQSKEFPNNNNLLPCSAPPQLSVGDLDAKLTIGASTDRGRSGNGRHIFMLSTQHVDSVGETAPAVSSMHSQKQLISPAKFIPQPSVRRVPWNSRTVPPPSGQTSFYSGSAWVRRQ